MGVIQQVGEYRRRALYGARTRSEVLTLTASPTLSPEVITLTRLTVSRAGVIVNWGDGSTTLLPVGSTAAVTHSYAAAGTYNIVVSDATAITQLSLNSAKVGGLNTTQLRNSAITYFLVTAITGSTIKSADMTAWTPTSWYLYSMPAGTYAIDSADMAAWTPTNWYLTSMPAGTYAIDSADMAAWTPTSWYLYAMPAGTYTIDSADMAAWTPTTWELSSMPVGAYTINTLNMAGWNPQTWYCYSMPAAGSSYTFNAGIMQNWTNARAIRADGLALIQAQVDLILLNDIYPGRMGYTYATPTLNVGGTNAAPSGVYADEDPPVTGKGAAFEIQNDPEAEGFNKWAVTFTP